MASTVGSSTGAPDPAAPVVADIVELPKVIIRPQDLKAFYLKHNPERSSDEEVIRVLKRYHNDHARLVVNLNIKYNDVPIFKKVGSSGCGSEGDADENWSAGSGDFFASALRNLPAVAEAASMAAAAAGLVAGAAAAGFESAPSRLPVAPAAFIPASSLATASVFSSSAPVSSYARAAPSGSAGGAAMAAAEATRQQASKLTQRLQELSQESTHLAAARDGAMARLDAVRLEVLDLEARWVEISNVAADAEMHVAESRRQAELFQKAVADREAQVLALLESRQLLAGEVAALESENRELEASCQQRLSLERNRKEKELLELAAFLKRSADNKEKRWKELSAEKARLERLEAARGCPGLGGFGDSAMMEAHSSVAKTFGDLRLEHPCVRLFDEPMVKITALLFRQPLLRRMFFAATALIWFFVIMDNVLEWL